MKLINKICAIVLTFILVISAGYTGESYALSRSSANNYKIVINCKTNKLGYFKDSKLVKEFPVGTGKEATQTPNGKFKIVNKIKNRPYYSGGIAGGDPKNPLGDRWLGLSVGLTNGTTYGIHGNNNESSIGSNVSGGCIRMHNKDVRWLFEQVPKGTEVIIYSSNETFIQAAEKYGINLVDERELNEKQKKVKSLFKEFAIYGPMNDPIIDLNNKNSIISTYNQADSILKTSSNGSSTDRQNFLNAWNSLSSSEKNNTEMKSIYSQYEKTIEIVEFAQASLKFFEDIKSNASNIILDYDKAKSLNSMSNMNLGASGRVKKEYDEAKNYNENYSNSKRMEYAYNKYVDGVNFLEVSKYLEERNVAKADEKMRRIKDDELRSVAKNTINNFDDTDGHWAKTNIKNAMQDGWITTTNVFRPNDSITRAEFVKIINKASGFSQKSNILFKDVNKNAWYYEEIKIAVGQGYISGYQDSTFRPNSPITREEVASIITTINKNKDSNLDKLSTYKDAHNVSGWAKSSVEGAIEAGYMGYGSDIFNPKSNITRAETIVTIQRIIN